MHLHPAHTFQPNVADVTEELRDKALKRTAEMLRKVDEVRRALELPVEQLPIVFKAYGKNVLALLAEAEREDPARLPAQEPNAPTVQQRLMEHNMELMRVNTQMFEGTVRMLAQQNTNLHEEIRLIRSECDRLRAQNAELRGELPANQSEH